jgi:hypothetical protein
MTFDLSWNGRLKVEIVVEIAHLVGAPAPQMSTGSTEPREIFDVVNRRLGLGIDPRRDKPGMARGIVEASGRSWRPDYESRGATVTKAGLVAVLHAVQFFVAE